jgi:hypothetical protein
MKNIPKIGLLNLLPSGSFQKATATWSSKLNFSHEVVPVRFSNDPRIKASRKSNELAKYTPLDLSHSPYNQHPVHSN